MLFSYVILSNLASYNRSNWKLTSEALKNAQFWIIAIPVFVAFVAILFIGAWIGWTMATTPPPKPIEEITSEIEEKKEEPKVEEPAPATEAAATEEKPAAKKKK